MSEASLEPHEHRLFLESRDGHKWVMFYFKVTLTQISSAI